jgi:uncharacterized protein (TIGR03437 family)
VALSTRQLAGIILFSTFPCVLFAAESRIVRPVDPSRLAVLRRQAPQQALPQYDLGPADNLAAIDYLTLRLKPADGLEQFLAEQRNPSSPNYHRWLTPEQFGERFGLTTDDLGKLVSWLQSEGLQVHDVARGRHWITFSGRVEQVSRAFHTEIHRYQVNGALHLANTTNPSIPAAFEDVVSGIDGLDDFDLQPLFQLEQPQFSSGTSRYLAPDDFATIYNVMPLYTAGIDGTGQTIAVIGRSGIDLGDVRQFRRSFNLPPNDPQLVLFGRDPGTTSSAIESNLDIEWAGAVARGATIVYAYANSVSTAAQYAVDQNLASVITFSYGGCEAYSSLGLRAVAQQANAQGITWLAASGDWGAATCDIVSSPTPQASKGPNASFPAGIPEITAVGGTEFDDGGGTSYWAANNTANGSSAVSYVPERTWNTALLRNDLSAGGGGPSVAFSKPNWQTGPGVPTDNARDVPDVSFASSPLHYAYIIYSGGLLIHVGGTSAASPSFAGVLGLLNQYLVSNGGQSQAGLGNINPMLYRLAQSTADVFHDITAGDNRVPCEQGSPGCGSGGMGYAAGPGYDLATGLGSVDAYHLVTEWKSGTATTTVLTATPNTVLLSDAVTLTATVSGKSSLPTGIVTFLTNDASIGTAALNGAGTATLSVPAINLASGNLTLTALYGGDGVFDGSAGTTTLMLNLPASGSLVVPSVTPNPVVQAGSFWPYTVGLSEKAGTGTTLTGFTIDGIRRSLGFWSSTNIPPKGTISATFGDSGINAPINRVFLFSGQDASGQAWTQQITVPFLPGVAPALVPGISVTGAPSTIRQNSQADPSCQWSQQLTIQETGGFLVQLTALRAGSSDFSTQIQQLFGTTRLAPYGFLQGTLCWDSTTLPGTKQIQVTGLSELETTVTASLSATFAPTAAAPPKLSVTPQSAQLAGNGVVQSDPFSIVVNLEGGTAAWTARVLPASRTTSWLKISGAAPGPLNVIASSVGLANGVYQAMVTIEAPNAIPAMVSVPVTMVVGGSPDIRIFGIRNNASGTVAFSPGMQVAVYGSGLAPGTSQTSRIPLPFTLGGVSATVNGISAPVYSVSSGQIDIQIPYETGSGTAVLAVNNNGQVASYSFPVTVAAPGIYNFFIDNNLGAQNTGRAGDVMTMFVSGAGDLTPSLATGASPSTLTPVRSLPRPRLPVTVSVGGEAANVAFAGNASGLVGAIQINFTLPGDLPPGPQPVIVSVGNAMSDPVNLTITP